MGTSSSYRRQLPGTDRAVPIATYYGSDSHDVTGRDLVYQLKDSGQHLVYQVKDGGVYQVKDSGRQVASRAPRRHLTVDDRPDLDHCLRPDPKDVRTAADLAEALRDFRAWAGDPPFRIMADQGGQVVSASTLYRALKPNAEVSANCGLLSLKVVIAVIAGCGGSEEDKQRFATAWRAIRMPAGRRPAQRQLRAVRPVAG